MGLLKRIMGKASEVSQDKVEKEFQSILIEGEEIEKAYKLIRDMFVFTNKRLILVDKQGLKGTKADYVSIPYKSITKFSKESTGLLDFDAELKIWVRGESTPLKKEFSKNDNVNEIYRILSKYVL